MDVPLRILIVDDEPEARELLAFMIRNVDGCEVSGLAPDVDEAIRLTRENTPDLVFLDIQMPDKDGFQFIEYIRAQEKQPGIVLVTAFDNYAIKAIRNAVFDYILKPIRKEELFSAIKRFRDAAPAKNEADLSKLIEILSGPGPDKVKMNTRSGYVLINPEDVVYCEADGNYTHIQMVNGNRELTTQNLGTIEDLFENKHFFRASRSYLLNLRYLSRVDRKAASCTLEYHGKSAVLKIPSQKIRMLETNFS